MSSYFIPSSKDLLKSLKKKNNFEKEKENCDFILIFIQQFSITSAKI